VGIDGNDDTAQVVAHNFPSLSVTPVEGPRRGLGANLNGLIKQAAADGYSLLFQLDDDHILMKPLDLKPHVEYLLAEASQESVRDWVAWIRLMGIGAHRYTATLDQRYWLVHWDSPELYIPSNRPHLKHILFHTYFGLYPEDKRLAETEEGFCHTCHDKAVTYYGTAKPRVAVPLNSESETAWEHIGVSWQGEGL
jgi:hypothetical protein